MVVDHENHSRNGPILPAGVLFCHIVSSFLQKSTEPGKHPGQTHLNSDAKIADEGHPQGGEGTHKGCPYLLFSAKKPASSRQRRLEFAIAHCDLHSSRRYALGRAPTRGEGHPQGVPLPSFFGQETGLQSPKTFGICDSALRSAQFSALCPGEGTHKGRPYQLFSLGVMPWGGHPQGAPLPIVFSRRYALGRAPTRGAPTNCFLQALCLGEGTHKGRPYQLFSLGVMPWGGHPQGAPLPIVFSRRYAQGTHKGRPYQLFSLGVMPWGGHPQGVPLPIVFSRRYALGRAPTRGAPTRFRQPQVGLSQFDAIALGKHQGVVIDHFARFTQGRELTMAESSLFAYESPCKRV